MEGSVPADPGLEARESDLQRIQRWLGKLGLTGQTLTAKSSMEKGVYIP